METKNQPIKDFLTWYLPAIIVILLWVMFSIKSNLINVFQKNNDIIQVTWVNISSWVQNVIVEQISWINQILTWDIIPSDPRGYIEYKLKTWTPGKNYFVINPEPQPIIHGKTSAENNQVLFLYANKYRYRISIPKNNWWYIMITLNKNLQQGRDLFLAIDWASKWALNKNLSEAVYDEKEFLYNIKKIPAWWYNISLLDYMHNWYLEIWWFVSEVWNWIQKITIVLK